MKGGSRKGSGKKATTQNPVARASADFESEVFQGVCRDLDITENIDEIGYKIFIFATIFFKILPHKLVFLQLLCVDPQDIQAQLVVFLTFLLMTSGLLIVPSHIAAIILILVLDVVLRIQNICRNIIILFAKFVF